jgi:predicted ATPase
MKAHYVSSIHVEALWGEKSISLRFHNDVNVIIGPNASGKTTIINLLMYTLTGDVIRLAEYQFDSIEVNLRPFDEGADTVVRVTNRDGEICFEVGDEDVRIPIVPSPMRMMSRGYFDITPLIQRRQIAAAVEGLKPKLEGLVPAAWLPVSRRLPFGDDDGEDPRRIRRGTLESVDHCLTELLSGLKRYRVSLDAHLAELRADFQRHALEVILYDKSHDRMLDTKADQAPTEDDKAQLLDAIRVMGFHDSDMSQRVDEHFGAAQSAFEYLRTNPSSFSEEVLFIIPLIHRTKQIVKYAQDLELRRQDLFAPLLRYEKIIASFIDGKDVSVTPQGELLVKRKGEPGSELEWRNLSSGEKQLLILLTQALLWEKDPVVYVADEPELSLHVTWQEKLLKSVTELAGHCQVIVATHSPDIAGGFPNRIIDLARI